VAAETLYRGFPIERSTDRGYRGQLKGIEDIEVAFLSAAEIAQNLREGKIDFGITGADLLWEKSAPQENLVSVLAALNFGFANVVVAVPECWLDVASMADLDEVSEASMCVMAAGSGWPPSISTSPAGSLPKRA
jgi:ATP phosphoribosyltransferase